ncbi:Protein NRT1/ PTR family 8.1 [Vitis vinifera]|uniref:Protein NRT1/ PTR family 8.1 n=1 Tax=Vitis vinifera TaxID=29760 RepID=A0A438ERG9_VITVI|nr:Protein NRT1/ PTR family 8.1 [Vitis vinifera]
MVSYLVFEMHQSIPKAATHVTDWIGAAYVLTILGAFLADACLGRFGTIVIFSSIYAVGMVLLTLSASIDSLHPPPCTKQPCKPASYGQTVFFSCALALIALGTGGIKPCVSSFGADQFDEADENEVHKKYAFFNWFFFAINIGALFGITLLVYIQVEKAGVGVIVASVRNHSRGVEVGREDDLYEVSTKESDIFGAVKLPHTAQYRVLPVWASTIALSISFAQLSTFFISQALIMDRKLGPSFVIPAGSIPVFSAITGLILVPIYEKWIVPILRRYTGHRRGITSLQRMGVGLFLSIIALASAALYFLMGSAEVFTYVGQLEFFYDEATDGTRSISSAIFLSEIGIGSWLSSAIVEIIEGTTGGEEKGWLRNDINKSRLDYFYWILAGINGVNFLIYLWIARRYKGKGSEKWSVRDVTVHG